MIKKFSDLLDSSDLACKLVTSMSTALGALFVFMAIFAGVLAVMVSMWWLLGFFAFGLLAGAFIGFAGFMYDAYC